METFTMKGEAYVKGWVNMSINLFFVCLTLVNQRCACVCFFSFRFDDLFSCFIYRLEITKFYISFLFLFFLFLPRLVSPQSSVKFHPFRFLGILIYLKRGSFIEKITLHSLQGGWRWASSQHRRVSAVSSGHTAGPGRRPSPSASRGPCVLSLSTPLARRNRTSRR